MIMLILQRCSVAPDDEVSRQRREIKLIAVVKPGK